MKLFNKIKIFLLIIWSLGLWAWNITMAQQLPQYSQYLLSDYIMNPAISGSRNYFEAKTNYRYQWLGIDDAPRTYVFSVNGPIYNKMGVGGYVYTDVTGPTRRTGGQLSYSYHFNLTDDIKLGLGTSVGVLQFAIDGSKITSKEIGDLVLSNGMQSATVADATAGFHLYSEKWYFNASAPQLFRNKIQFFEESTSSIGRLVNHFFIMGGYRYDLNETFTIIPSILFKYVSPLPMQNEPTVRVIYKDQIWLATSYRNSLGNKVGNSLSSDAFVTCVGYTYRQNISFGYSFDVTMSNLKNYSSGSHEVMLAIRFHGQKKTSTPSIDAMPETTE